MRATTRNSSAFRCRRLREHVIASWNFAATTCERSRLAISAAPEREVSAGVPLVSSGTSATVPMPQFRGAVVHQDGARLLPWQGVFLATLQMRGNVRAAAAKAGIARSSAYGNERSSSRIELLLRPTEVRVIVSRGGRPDPAGEALPKVNAPTLLILGGIDDVAVHVNEEACRQMRCEVKLEIVPGFPSAKPAPFFRVPACEWSQASGRTFNDEVDPIPNRQDEPPRQSPRAIPSRDAGCRRAFVSHRVRPARWR